MLYFWLVFSHIIFLIVFSGEKRTPWIFEITSFYYLFCFILVWKFFEVFFLICRRISFYFRVIRSYSTSISRILNILYFCSRLRNGSTILLAFTLFQFYVDISWKRTWFTCSHFYFLFFFFAYIFFLWRRFLWF